MAGMLTFLSNAAGSASPGHDAFLARCVEDSFPGVKDFHAAELAQASQSIRDETEQSIRDSIRALCEHFYKNTDVCQPKGLTDAKLQLMANLRTFAKDLSDKWILGKKRETLERIVVHVSIELAALHDLEHGETTYCSGS